VISLGATDEPIELSASRAHAGHLMPKTIPGGRRRTHPAGQKNRNGTIALFGG